MTIETKKRANSVYTFAVQDGKQVFDFAAIGKIVFDPDKVSAENRARAMAHGFKQRIVDAGALEAGAGGKVDPVAKFNEMFRVAEHLMSGSAEWNVKGGGAGASSYVTRALVALGTFAKTDVSTHDKANAFVKSLAESTKPEVIKYGFKGQVGKARAWLEANSKAISAEIDKIKAAEAADVTPADADAILDDLMGD
jgi:hypothetical protein